MSAENGAPDQSSIGALVAESKLQHSEFGHCSNPVYRWRSSYDEDKPFTNENDSPSYTTVLSTYICYIALIIMGHIADYFGKRFYKKDFINLRERDGYAALNSDFDSFFTRRLKVRLDYCFDRPVTGVCGRTVITLDRGTKDFGHSYQLTGGKTRALNVSAYNYLGFAQSHGECADAVDKGLNLYGISSGGTRLGGGYLDLQKQAEQLVARFLRVDDAMLVSMGYATNSTTIPAVAGPGTLIISDELNHTSLRAGVRISGASIRTYKHADLSGLEELLRESISQGQPRSHRPWKKILLLVEGLYSMEGTIVNLPKVIELAKRYKVYLYVDEAHSIGALGPQGGGVCDYFGINRDLVDIHMGTFTKSFGAVGGYIAGRKELIDRIRMKNHANVYAETMSPPVLVQIIATIAAIMRVGQSQETMALMPRWMSFSADFLAGVEGQHRLERLAFNARYLNHGLRKLGFIVWGSRDSPVVPLLLFQPGKMNAFSVAMLNRHMALPPSVRWEAEDKDWNGATLEHSNVHVSNERGEKVLPRRPPIVVVVVAYPATPLISSRVRFCVSASHTKQDIDDVLLACDEIGNALALKYSSGGPGGCWSLEKVISHPLELVSWNGTDFFPEPA
ncbi:serine C-palmitoyltransferase [Malassezia vespertilionis]|uniref:serine C-palmitoyltransferase n=1 Tax=Malassezia vespertilionis TaxID=2020962 RepID=A0A2N1JDE6_9BASI|nr:serine C-palmitoyltransferase [Malassezia vespertilionis]PKI84559.1 Lcb2p [Malassezia vespertilionis]WFD06334.1 serine C-palmitoyltransferase [Malassezia vespertilionis]